MPFTLPPLPYAADALAPFLSRESLDLHHGKHHQAYVTKLNELLQGTPLARLSLEELLKATFELPPHETIFNNAAQHWNHSFFWNSMNPSGSSFPAPLRERVEQSFGSVENFKHSFQDIGLSQFGSGWVWLIESGADLKIVKTPNAATPLVYGDKPLLVCDVWEHAYYVDYRNRRGDYLRNFLDHLADWEGAAARLLS